MLFDNVRLFSLKMHLKINLQIYVIYETTH